MKVDGESLTILSLKNESPAKSSHVKERIQVDDFILFLSLSK